MSLVRMAKDLRFKLFYGLLTKRGTPLVTLGGLCQWTFSDTGLDSESRVLCAGAGHDISFEKSLISKYGCRVVLLDPSPTGIATVEREQAASDRLRFMQVGLAGKDGVLSFQEPVDAREGSFRAGGAKVSARVEFPCRSLSSLMKEFGWTRIDLLKMDVEGCEYEVIRELLKNQINVRQICLEFHYGPAFGHTRGEMIRAILALIRAGYRLTHRTNQDHTFMKREPQVPSL